MSSAWNARVIAAVAAGMVVVAAGFYWIGARDQVRPETEKTRPLRRLSGLPAPYGGADMVEIYRRVGKANPETREGQTTEQALARLRLLAGVQGRVRDVDAMMLASVLEEDEIGEALTVIEELPEPARSEIGFAILYRWAQWDPLAAIGYARSDFDNIVLRTGIPKIVGIWAQYDAEAALEWYRSNREIVSEKALTHIFSAMAENDIEGAIASAIELGTEEEKLKVGSAWWGIASLVAVDSLRVQIIGAIESIDEVNTRKGASRDLLSIWARTEPSEAAAWLDRQGYVGEGFDTAVVQHWTDIDPKAAADWALARQERDRSPTDSPLAELVEGWIRDDPESAGAWILENGVLAERSMSVMLENLAGRGDIEKAIAWAESGPAENRDKLIAEAIALAVKFNAIEMGEIGKYTMRGSLDPDAMAAEVEAAMSR